MSKKKSHSASQGETPAPKPLENVDVYVDARPQTDHPDALRHAQRVDRQLTKEVSDAIGSAREGGSEKQLDAAKKKVKETAKKLNPGTIKRVKVRVTGRVDGETVRRDINEPTGDPAPAPAQKKV